MCPGARCAPQSLVKLLFFQSLNASDTCEKTEVQENPKKIIKLPIAYCRYCSYIIASVNCISGKVRKLSRRFLQWLGNLNTG